MKEPKLKDLRHDKAGTKRVKKIVENAKKVKITINFDEDILDEIKKIAKEVGAPYQSFFNKFVREALAEREEKGGRLSKLEKEVRALKKKVG